MTSPSSSLLTESIGNLGIRIVGPLLTIFNLDKYLNIWLLKVAILQLTPGTKSVVRKKIMLGRNGCFMEDLILFVLTKG